MNGLRRLAAVFLVCALCSLANAVPAAPQIGQSSTARDGQRDFDFDFGTWKIHIKRMEHPLSGLTRWVELDGTIVVRKIWDGRANLAEVEADGPSGHLELLSLRLYNPESRQWSLNFARGNGGTLSVPMVGEFKNGQGEFYDQETFEGRVILVRIIVSAISSTAGHSEQAFSDDGGKTWEVNWINDYTRIKDDADIAQSDTGGANGNHDFDFNFGSWRTHMKRLQHPLTGSTHWVELNGTVVTRKVWGGRAQIEEVEADGPKGHFEDLGLFLYDPQARQWSMNFANSRIGMVGMPPTIGEFRNGRGEFYDQETYNGRSILVRCVWSEITPDSHRFEQSFSDDEGKTWEPNVIAILTRDKQ
jgi:BNR/Asp-box repeat protein